MKITVITINYNNLPGLKETLGSVLEQTYKNIEYIVIDGGSTDGSKDLIESNSNKISYWVSERDSGVYNAMNKGLDKITGDYVIFMNSGDIFYSKNTLTDIAPQLSGEDIIYGNTLDVNFIDGSGDRFIYFPKELSFRFFYADSLRHQATFIKRELYKKLGGYDESHRIISDWKFMLLALVQNQATYKHIDSVICRYDMSGISMTNQELGLNEKHNFLNEYFRLFMPDYKMVSHPDENGSNLNAKYRQKVTIKFLIKSFLPYGLVRLIEKTLNRRR